MGAACRLVALSMGQYHGWYRSHPSLHGGQVFGLTLPLVTKADGTKFGKTESGTIWLDAKGRRLTPSTSSG